MKDIFKTNFSDKKKKQFEDDKNYIFYYLKNYLDDSIKILENKMIDNLDLLKRENKNIPLSFIVSNKDKDFLNYTSMVDDDYEDIYISGVFLDLDYFERKKIEDMTFKAYILFADSSYEAIVKFKKDGRYIEKLKHLKNKVFMNNKNIEFIPTYILDRMYKIEFLSLDDNITINEIKNISNLQIEIEGDINERIRYNTDIFWNVEKISLVYTENILERSENNIYTKYIFNKDINDLYILDEEENKVLGILENENSFIITSTKKEKKIWNFFKINDIETEESNTYNNVYTFKNFLNIFNDYYISSLINQNNFFKEYIKVKLTNDNLEQYIIFDENLRDGRIKNMKVIILKKDNYTFDRIKLLKEILESKFKNLCIKVMLDE